MATLATDFSFREVLAHKKLFIRSYQRPYAWDEKQWSDLWNDLFYMHIIDSEEGKKRFLGNIILKPLDEEFRSSLINKSQDNETINFYEIVDGQQRITTVLVLLSVISHQLKEKNEAVSTKIQSMFQLQLRGSQKYYPLITTTRTDITKLLHLLLTVGITGKKKKDTIDESTVQLPLLDVSGSSVVSDDDNTDVYDMSDEFVQRLRAESENKRSLAAKNRLCAAYRYFTSKINDMQNELTDHTNTLLDFDSLIREGFRFTCYIQSEKVNVIETFMGINDRGKVLNALENTKALFIGFARRLVNHELREKIEKTWDFVYDSLADASLFDDKEEVDFLSCAWTAMYMGSIKTQNLFASINTAFSMELDHIVKSKQSKPSTPSTPNPPADEVTVIIESDSDTESESEAERPAKRRRITKESSPRNLESFADSIRGFLNFMKQTVPVYSWLKGEVSRTALLFGEEHPEKLEYVLECLKISPFFDKSIPLILAAHFNCVMYANFKYRTKEYAKYFLQFLELLKLHLIVWSISLETDVSHLDNYATMLFHAKNEENKDIYLDWVYLDIVDRIEVKNDKITQFVTQKFDKQAQRSKTSKALKLVAVEYKIQEMTSDNHEKLKLIREFEAKKLGYINKARAGPHYHSIGNRYIMGEGVPKQSVPKREKGIIEFLKDQLNSVIHGDDDEDVVEQP